MTSAGISIPILMYHSISDVTTPGYRQWTVTPSRFNEHVAALTAEGWTFSTFGAASTAMRERTGPPAKTAVITVDDGLADFHQSALATLETHRAVATLFIPTAYIGGTTRWLPGEDSYRSVLTWAQIQEAAEIGIEIGSHGHLHAPVDVGSESKILADFSMSRQILEDGLGRSVQTIAYPYGYHRAKTRRMVTAAGYSSACAVIGMPAISSDDQRALPRIPVTQDIDGPGLLRAIGRQYNAIERRANHAKHTLWELARLTGTVGPDGLRLNRNGIAPEVPA